jgi:Mycothiol maleylpyruvate isomerase N-terminal domain
MGDGRTPVELWADGQRGLSALGRSLTDHEAGAHVPACPRWSVRDVFAHQAGVAADVLAGRLDGAATDEWTGRQVAERADEALTDILDEWDRDAVDLIDVLGGLGDAFDPRLLTDQWTHEQDIRGAVIRPGNREDERARWVVGRLARHYAQCIDEAGLAPIAIDLGEGGDEPPGGRLRVEPFEFARARLGRRSPTQIHAWHWEVDSPEAYAAVVPIFGPRQTELIEPA